MIKKFNEYSLNEDINKSISKTDIENIIKKNFQKVNREGLGFLKSKMEKCTNDIFDLIEKNVNKKL